MRSCACKMNHSHQLTRFCRGAERGSVKKVLRHMKPMSYVLDSIAKADEEFIKNGNLQGVKSTSAIRKMRQEVLEANDLAKSQISAVVEMQKHDLSKKKGQSSILKVASPLKVVVCCEKRRDLLKFAAQESKKQPSSSYRCHWQYCQARN